jgi:hypothetical protein
LGDAAQVGVDGLAYGDVVDARQLIRRYHVWYGRDGEPPRLLSTHRARRDAEAAITAYLGVSYFVDDGFGGMNELGRWLVCHHIPVGRRLRGR